MPINFGGNTSGVAREGRQNTKPVGAARMAIAAELGVDPGSFAVEQMLRDLAPQINSMDRVWKMNQFAGGAGMDNPGQSLQDFAPGYLQNPGQYGGVARDWLRGFDPQSDTGTAAFDYYNEVQGRSPGALESAIVGSMAPSWLSGYGQGAVLRNASITGYENPYQRVDVGTPFGGQGFGYGGAQRAGQQTPYSPPMPEEIGMTGMEQGVPGGMPPGGPPIPSSPGMPPEALPGDMEAPMGMTGPYDTGVGMDTDFTGMGQEQPMGGGQGDSDNRQLATALMMVPGINNMQTAQMLAGNQMVQQTVQALQQAGLRGQELIQAIGQSIDPGALLDQFQGFPGGLGQR